MSRINDIRFRVFLKFPLPFYMKEGGASFLGSAFLHSPFCLIFTPITGYKIFFLLPEKEKLSDLCTSWILACFIFSFP